MAENVENQSNWLAIASFVLALVGWVLCLTIVGGILWVICWILAFIFAIVALCKKQGSTRASVIGLIISLLWIIITVIGATLLWKVWNEHKDEFINPVTDLVARVDENPDVAKLMENKEFSDKFNELLEQRLSERYDENAEDSENFGSLVEVWNSIFEEVKATLTDLAEEEWVEVNSLEMEEEVVEDVIEEATEEVVEEVVEEVEETAEEVAEEVVEEVVAETVEEVTE